MAGTGRIVLRAAVEFNCAPGGVVAAGSTLLHVSASLCPDDCHDDEQVLSSAQGCQVRTAVLEAYREYYAPLC
ncbi:hypothetical protein BA177_11700 [Woeseia oceani]|uniref:Uncharacterized protein n=1 Tax=Woeseia oceani TaxID=1548547 RepID=A0A193LGZ0_9GAMM|nr:hypothetical protein BA177_11700 [Woeseia oceani]